MIKSKFDSMKREILFSIFAIFGDFLAKNEGKCWFSSKLQKSTERVTSYYFEDFLPKDYLSSIAFSQLMAPVLWISP